MDIAIIPDKRMGVWDVYVDDYWHKSFSTLAEALHERGLLEEEEQQQRQNEQKTEQTDVDN